MIDLAFDPESGEVTLAAPAVVKFGAGVPCRLTFPTAPQTITTLVLALGTDATPSSVLAYNGAWTAESPTVWTTVLDCSDERLATYMGGKGQTTVNAELSLTTGGVFLVCPNFAVAVQPAIVTGPTTSDGGPTYLEAANNLAEITSTSAARGHLGLGSSATHAASDFQAAGSYEHALGNPDADGKALVSTAAGVRSWAAKENALGNPGADGYVLKSLANGTRSWAAESGGGGSITIPGVARVESTGSDSTGVVGDLTKPFASVDAAIAAGGVCELWIGVGGFTANFPSGGSFVLRGRGYENTLLNVNIPTAGLEVIDGGGRSLSLNVSNPYSAVGNVSIVGGFVINVNLTPSGASNGTDAVDLSTGATTGAAGIGGSTVGLYGCFLAGNVLCSGQDGGGGGNPYYDPGDGTYKMFSNGGAGGGGGSLTMEDCHVSGYIAVTGGNGGLGNYGYPAGAAPTDMTNGGAGGVGGFVNLVRVTVVGSVYVSGGNVGTSSSGYSSFPPASSGTIAARFTEVQGTTDTSGTLNRVAAYLNGSL